MNGDRILRERRFRRLREGSSGDGRAEQDRVVDLQVAAPEEPGRLVPGDGVVAVLGSDVGFAPLGGGHPVGGVEARLGPADPRVPTTKDMVKLKASPK